MWQWFAVIALRTARLLPLRMQHKKKDSWSCKSPFKSVFFSCCSDAPSHFSVWATWEVAILFMACSFLYCQWQALYYSAASSLSATTHGPISFYLGIVRHGFWYRMSIELNHHYHCSLWLSTILIQFQE